MMNIRRSSARDERGAVLVHAALAMLTLIAFSAFAVDYGALLLARSQAQNSADAAALAGALSLMVDADVPRAQAAAKAVGEANRVLGAGPSIDLARSPADVRPITCPPGAPGLPDTCIRADVYRTNRDARSSALPTFFAQIMDITSQEVRATATAQASPGNQVKCLLPFALIDRWADNHDPTPDATHFSNDGLSGVAGWTPNDSYEPTMTPADVYVPPYDGYTNHTGWTMAADYGRQVILKDGGPGNYSAGWSQLVCLSGGGNCGGPRIKDPLTECNPRFVGIAEEIDIRQRVSADQSLIQSGVDNLVASDAAVWNPTADGPAGPGRGAVTGGQGMASRRIRGMVVLDINHYAASCTGATCVGKVANIVGFFVEGICNTVALDAGMVCDDPDNDVVGRIVTLPGQYAGGTGTVEDDASFIRRVLLVR